MPGAKPDGHERGLDDARRRIRRTGEHGLGLACGNHRPGAIEWLLQQARRHGIGQLFAPCTDQCDVPLIGLGNIRLGEDDGTCEIFRHKPLRRHPDAFITALRHDQPELPSPDPGHGLVNCPHCPSLMVPVQQELAPKSIVSSRIVRTRSVTVLPGPCHIRGSGSAPTAEWAIGTPGTAETNHAGGMQ